MRLIVDDELKIAGFWLSRTERDDEELKASLKPQFAEWKAKNYLPVVYESGDGDLKESIYCLLKHHIEKKAKAEVEAESEARYGRHRLRKRLPGCRMPRLPAARRYERVLFRLNQQFNDNRHSLRYNKGR